MRNCSRNTNPRMLLRESGTFDEPLIPITCEELAAFDRNSGNSIDYAENQTSEG
jgi:hypothetical protein